MAPPIRRLLSLLAALLALLPATGCWVYSVQPLVESDEELVFDRLLLGNWWQPRDGCSLVFSRFYEERTYRVVYASPPERKGKGCLLDEGRSAAFDGKLVEIGDTRYLDLYPVDREPKHHEVLLHSFYRIRVDASSLVLTPMNPEWIKSQVEQQRLALTGRVSNERVVLTNSTKELRELLRTYGSSDELFSTASRQSYERRPGA